MIENLTKKQKTTIIRNITIVFATTMLYALLRYNIFGPVPLADIPTLITNKAIAFSMILILLIAFVGSTKGRQEIYCAYLKLFKILAITHVLFSIILLSQQYFPKLLIYGRFSLFGNLAMLFGVLTFVFLFHNKSRLPIVVAYVLAALHLFFIGVKGWLDVLKWNAMMPPITLLCFLLLIVLIIFSMKKPGGNSQREQQ